MTVLKTEYDYPYSSRLQKSHKCSTCGGNLYFPFVCWEGGDDVCICGKCCQQIKDGLMADMIQVAAALNAWCRPRANIEAPPLHLKSGRAVRPRHKRPKI